MEDTIALLTAMEKIDLERAAKKASNELTLSMARNKKAQGFLEFFKAVKDDDDAKQLLGITDNMKLEDFIKCYKQLCDMQ